MTARLVERAPRPRDAASHRFGLSRRLSVLCEHHDAIEAAGADTESIKLEIRKTLTALLTVDALLTNDTGESP